MAKDLVFLGAEGPREYYYSPSEDSFYWRVPEIRETLRAWPGHVLVSADYSQIEVKLMAFLSRDKFLIEAINSGKDIHSYLASEIIGVPYEEIVAARKDPSHPRHHELDSLRSAVKAITFGLPYGAGPNKIATQIAQVTGRKLDDALVEEARELIEKYFSRARGLKRWLDDQCRLGVEKLHSRSLLGRIRWYELPDPDDPGYHAACAQVGRYACNHPIQASSADMLKLAISSFYRAVRQGRSPLDPLHGARLVMTVHDEIVVMCQKEGAEEIARILCQSMDEAYAGLTLHYVDRRGNRKSVRMGDLLPLEIVITDEEGNRVTKPVGVKPVISEFLTKE